MIEFDPLTGRPNPELERITPPQILLLAVVVMGIAVLIGSLFYLLSGVH